MDDEKTRAERLRRAARRLGFALRRAEPWTARGAAGTWYLIDPRRGFLVRECRDLDEAEAWLARR